MTEQNYKGCLLAAHPKRPESVLRKGVVLILDHDKSGAIGLQLNKPFTNDITFENVMQNVGLHTDQDQPLYHGGPESTNRIHIVHSLDWYSPHTTKVSPSIGVSHDISVLAAIAKNEGPEYFRVIAGFYRWLPGHLEGEISGRDPWTVGHTWGVCPSDIDSIFASDDIDQWHKMIAEAGRLEVSNWF